MAFPFLKLPPELRHRIYLYAFVPPAVRFSRHTGAISMYAFSTKNGGFQPRDEEAVDGDGYSTVPVTLSRFLICTQLWYEISYLFFTYTVWTFASVGEALTCLQCIPPETRRMVCKIDFTFPHISSAGELKIRPSKDLGGLLPKLPRLRVLYVHVRLEAFCSSKWTWDRAVMRQRPSGEHDQLAAKWVNQFVSRGVETRLPFQEEKLSKYFLEELKRLCGEQNVRLEPAGRDRYAGDLVHIVIGSASPSRFRAYPPRLASFDRALSTVER